PGCEVGGLDKEHGAVQAPRSQVAEGLRNEGGRQAAVPEFGEHAHRADVPDGAASHDVYAGAAGAYLDAARIFDRKDIAGGVAARLGGLGGYVWPAGRFAERQADKLGPAFEVSLSIGDGAEAEAFGQ